MAHEAQLTHEAHKQQREEASMLHRRLAAAQRAHQQALLDAVGAARRQLLAAEADARDEAAGAPALATAVDLHPSCVAARQRLACALGRAGRPREQERELHRLLRLQQRRR